MPTAPQDQHAAGRRDRSGLPTSSRLRASSAVRSVARTNPPSSVSMTRRRRVHSAGARCRLLSTHFRRSSGARVIVAI
jgi:hypothetical protein